MFGKPVVRCVLAMAVMAAGVVAQADVFNMPAGSTSIQMVNVNDAGNAADTNGMGAVSDPFSIDAYDVTVGQYTQFLNAVAKADPYGLYYTNTNTLGAYPPINMAPGKDMLTFGINRTGSSGAYVYTVGTAVGPGGGTISVATANNMPMFDVTYGMAARFCNWLDNGQPTAAEGLSTTESGSYYLNGMLMGTGTANAQAWANLQSTTDPGAVKGPFYIPTGNQLYKAAYYAGGNTGNLNAGYYQYPTKSNTQPSNVLSPSGTNNANFNSSGSSDPVNFLTPVGYFADSPGPYGTFDQGGDVMEWTTDTDVTDSLRGLRAGGFSTNVTYLSSTNEYFLNPNLATALSSGYGFVGFRIATPEPGSLALALCGAIGVLIWWRRRS